MSNRTRNRHPDKFIPRYGEREMQLEQSLRQIAAGRLNTEHQFIHQQMGIAVNCLTQIHPDQHDIPHLRKAAADFLEECFKHGKVSVAALPVIEPDDTFDEEDEGPALGGGGEQD